MFGNIIYNLFRLGNRGDRSRSQTSVPRSGNQDRPAKTLERRTYLCYQVAKLEAPHMVDTFGWMLECLRLQREVNKANSGVDSAMTDALAAPPEKRQALADRMSAQMAEGLSIAVKVNAAQAHYEAQKAKVGEANLEAFYRRMEKHPSW